MAMADGDGSDLQVDPTQISWLDVRVGSVA